VKAEKGSIEEGERAAVQPRLVRERLNKKRKHVSAVFNPSLKELLT